jgi:hypothetical protein
MIGSREHVATECVGPTHDIAEVRRGGRTSQDDSERQTGHAMTIAQPKGCASF